MEKEDTYQYLVDRFGKKELEFRHKEASDFLLSYLETEGLKPYAEISLELMEQAVTDFYADIERIKGFHSIDLVNSAKIYSYLAYWLWRRKPLQITVEDIPGDKLTALKFMNEEMVSAFLESLLFREPSGVVLANSKREEHDVFLETMRYYLKYRAVNPQCLELMICAFRAGRAYQYSVDFQE